MPPGSAESLPPSNAKPYTPSLSNGVSGAKLLTAAVSSLQAQAEPGMDQDQLAQPPPSAPKHFKKRFLASATNQPAAAAGAGPSSASVSPGAAAALSPSPSPVAGVSPEAATACEALMELSRTESRASRSSEGSGSDRRGSPSEAQPLQTLREAVWTKVATTLLKQEEEKLVEPPKDSPMNLSQQCTIRGQQIIEHIIENILDKPMEGHGGAPCEPINVSVNNNQEEGIKASIYESLKNDLLKGKSPLMTSSKSAPTTPPGSREGSGKVGGTAGAGPALGAPPPLVPTTKAGAGQLVLSQAQAAKVTSGHKLAASVSVSPVSSSAASSVSSSPASLAPSAGSHSPSSMTPPGGAAASGAGHQDVLRLLARSSQLPINVGSGAITITKTPRPVAQPSQLQAAASVASAAPAVSSVPVSVSLTRTGGSSQQQVFNLSSVPGVVLSSAQPGSVVLGPGAAQLQLLSPSSVSPQHMILQQPGQVGQVVLAAAGPGQPAQPLLLPAGSKLILAAPPTSHAPAPRPGGSSVTIAASGQDNCDPVNLTVAKPRPGLHHDNNHTASHSPQQIATLKRPASISDGDDDDIRRSSRQSKGKRYQEFIEDGRINVGAKLKRRSHRSGDTEAGLESGDSPASEPEPLVQTSSDLSAAAHATNNQINHWKKKLRTVSLGENTQAGPALTATPPPHLVPSHAHQQQRSSASSRPSRHTAAGSFDVKLGNKKLRGEKISH